MGNFTVRFAVAFTGRMMVHCHILKHEDLGMMTLVESIAAPDVSWNAVSLASDSGPVATKLGVVLAIGGIALFLALVCAWGVRIFKRSCKRCHGDYTCFE